MKTLLSIQNPFRVARLRSELAALSTVEQIQRHDWDENTREFMRATHKGEMPFSTQLRFLTMALQAELGNELAKPNGVRAYGQTSHGQDDSWRVWVVFTKEFSATLPPWNNIESDDDTRDTFRAACAEVWASLGFDAGESPLSDYSPTGRMFQHSLCCYRAANGCVILRQSGGRDI